MITTICSIIGIISFFIMAIGMIGVIVCMVIDNFVIGDVCYYMVGFGFGFFIWFLTIVNCLSLIGC